MAVAVGANPESMIPKERQLAKIIPAIARMSLRYRRATGGKLRLFDLNAGTGRNTVGDEELDASSLIMADFIEGLDDPWEVVLIELQQSNFEQLFENLTNGDYRLRHESLEYWPDALCGDNREIAPDLCARGSSRDRGLVFFDDNGETDFELAATLSRLDAMQGVDFGLMVPTVTLKLIHAAAESPRLRDKGRWAERRLDGSAGWLHERLAGIQKRHWMVRKPFGPFGFTFLYGTNYRWRGGWANEGFHWTDTTEGHTLLMDLSLPKRERPGMRRLF